MVRLQFNSVKALYMIAYWTWEEKEIPAPRSQTLWFNLLSHMVTLKGTHALFFCFSRLELNSECNLLWKRSSELYPRLTFRHPCLSIIPVSSETMIQLAKAGIMVISLITRLSRKAVVLLLTIQIFFLCFFSSVIEMSLRTKRVIICSAPS